jgi:hypothetical protein
MKLSTPFPATIPFEITYEESRIPKLGLYELFGPLRKLPVMCAAEVKNRGEYLVVFRHITSFSDPEERGLRGPRQELSKAIIERGISHQTVAS